MVTPLIPDRVLSQIKDIADRTRRSTCRIQFREKIKDTRGGTKLGPEQWRGPYPCRLDPSGLSGQEGLRGEQMVSTAYAAVALPLDVVPPDNEDKIEVTTPLVGGGVQVQTFNVIGNPFTPSYGVETYVSVTKVD
jgi:hypothetical protein